MFKVILAIGMLTLTACTQEEIAQYVAKGATVCKVGKEVRDRVLAVRPDLAGKGQTLMLATEEACRMLKTSTP